MSRTRLSSAVADAVLPQALMLLLLLLSGRALASRPRFLQPTDNTSFSSLDSLAPTQPAAPTDNTDPLSNSSSNNKTLYCHRVGKCRQCDKDDTDDPECRVTGYVEKLQCWEEQQVNISYEVRQGFRVRVRFC